jgi:hypothetical protein
MNNWKGLRRKQSYSSGCSIPGFACSESGEQRSALLRIAGVPAAIQAGTSRMLIRNVAASPASPIDLSKIGCMGVNCIQVSRSRLQWWVFEKIVADIHNG